MRFALVLVVLALGRPAIADDDTERSPDVAVALSLVPTLGGIAITAWGSTLYEKRADTAVAVGLVTANLGPTIGNVYAGDVWNLGLQTRLAGAGFLVVGGAMVLGCYRESCNSSTVAYLGGGMLVVGSLTYVVGAAIEIGNAYGAANAHNMRLEERRSRLSLVPVVRTTDAGLAIAGTF